MVSPIADTFGEALLGLVFSAVFYGVTLMQTYQYYDTCRSDGWFMKTLVAVIFVLDTAQLGLVIHVVWFYLIDSFGHPENLILVIWSLLAQIIFSTTIASIVQFFFAYRIRLLSRNWFISFLIVVFAILHLAFDIYFVIALLQKGTFLAIPGLTWATSTSLANSVASDVLVAGAMCFYLLTSKSGISRTDHVVNNLILYAVSTGFLTTIFSLVTLILFAVSPTFLSQMFYFSIAKFYTNSLLASLNSREKMRHLFASGTANSIHLSDMRPGATAAGSRSRSDPAMSINHKQSAIHVAVSRHVDHDAGMSITRSHSGAEWVDDDMGKPAKGYTFV